MHCVDNAALHYRCCCRIMLILLLYHVDAVVASKNFRWRYIDCQDTGDAIWPDVNLPPCWWLEVWWGPDAVEDLMMMRTWCCWEPGAVEDLMLMKTWLWRISSLLRGSVEFWVASKSILHVFHIFMMYYCTFHIYYCSGYHVRILHMVLPSEKVIFTQSKLLGQPSVFWGCFRLALLVFICS